MTEFGLMAVDWEERIDFDRMRRYRLDRAKQALRDSEADVLFVIRLEDVRYLTGFRHHLGPVVMLAGAVAVLPSGGDPILCGPDWPHVLARMPWMPRDRVWQRVDFGNPSHLKAWAEQLEATIGSLRGKKIGIDLLTLTMKRQLMDAFPHSEFVDGWPILGKAKLIKSEDEIECLKAACFITEAGLDAGLRALRPGVRECEVLGEIWGAMAALGSEWTQCSNIVASGPEGTYPKRRFTTDRIIRMGDPVVIDVGGCYNGYWGDFTRTWICGDIQPTVRQKELYQIMYDSLWACCLAAKPGNTHADVVNAARPNFVYQMGHGAGVNPFEVPFFNEDAEFSPVTIEPGMVFNLDPFVGEPGVGGFKAENNVVVRESGPEIFSTYPHDERLLFDVHPLDATTGRVRRPGR